MTRDDGQEPAHHASADGRIRPRDPRESLVKKIERAQDRKQAKQEAESQSMSSKSSKQSEAQSNELTQLPEVGEEIAQKLRGAGYEDRTDLAEVNPKQLASEIDGMTVSTAIQIRADINPYNTDSHGDTDDR